MTSTPSNYWERDVRRQMSEGRVPLVRINIQGPVISVYGGDQKASLKAQAQVGIPMSWKSKLSTWFVWRNRQMSTAVFMVVFVTVVMFLNPSWTDRVFTAYPKMPRIHEATLLFSLPEPISAPNTANVRIVEGQLEAMEDHAELPPDPELEVTDDYGPYIPTRGRRNRTSCWGFSFAKNTTVALERKFADMSQFQNFTLNYVQKLETQESDGAMPDGASVTWEPKFGGHQTLEQREKSYRVTSEPIHCGFVDSEFELSTEDSDYMKKCRIVVSSAIFGDYDYIHDPPPGMISEYSIENVCLVMFLDQQSYDGANGTFGLWRPILIRNLPYRDNRLTGKIPKFLSHRLFPNAEYSIWIDSKLRLLNDPVLILDQFLWQGIHEYAIADHFSRHAVWEEVEENKKRHKFDPRRIDGQFEFYKKNGLRNFNASQADRPLLSHVPEGSVIVRAHTPMSNLFSCLWFNEVDRFTTRDQLSFGYTYLKLVTSNPSRHFRLNMFKDCERRAVGASCGHKRRKSKPQQAQAAN